MKITNCIIKKIEKNKTSEKKLDTCQIEWQSGKNSDEFVKNVTKSQKLEKALKMKNEWKKKE